MDRAAGHRRYWARKNLYTSPGLCPSVAIIIVDEARGFSRAVTQTESCFT